MGKQVKKSDKTKHKLCDIDDVINIELFTFKHTQRLLMTQINSCKKVLKDKEWGNYSEFNRKATYREDLEIELAEYEAELKIINSL